MVRCPRSGLRHHHHRAGGLRHQLHQPDRTGRTHAVRIEIALLLDHRAHELVGDLVLLGGVLKIVLIEELIEVAFSLLDILAFPQILLKCFQTALENELLVLFGALAGRKVVERGKRFYDLRAVGANEVTSLWLSCHTSGR